MKQATRKTGRASQWLPAFVKLACLLAAALTACPLSSLALGSRIPNQDPTAIGRGNAFAATADNASAIYYNPAGITQLEGNNVQINSLFYLDIYADYKSPSGQKFENEHDVVTVPSLYYALAPKDFPLAFGLGVYAPFGLGMKWPGTVPFRNAGLEAALQYITVNPVVAWRLLPNLSLAVGPTLNYSEAKLRQGVAVSPLEFRFKGTDWAYGFNAGLLWEPLPKWSLGAKYFSATRMDYSGTASFNVSPPLPPPSHTETHLDFPQIIVGAVSFRPDTNWNFEVDVDWTDWDQTKAATIDGIATLALNWNSSFFYEVGVTRQLGKGYYASAGYFFSEASTPSHYYTPLVPDTDLHVGSLGVGYRGKQWDWALAGQLIGGGYRNVTDAVNPTVNGSYKIFTPTFSFSVGLHF